MDFKKDLFDIERKLPPPNFARKTMKFIEDNQLKEHKRKNEIASFQFNIQTLGKTMFTVGVALFILTFLPIGLMDFTNSPKYNKIAYEIQSFQDNSNNIAEQIKEKIYDNVKFIKE